MHEVLPVSLLMIIGYEPVRELLVVLHRVQLGNTITKPRVAKNVRSKFVVRGEGAHLITTLSAATTCRGTSQRNTLTIDP